MLEIGSAGSSAFRGVITEEYNSKLQGANGIKIYDEMRKSDATVRAATLVTSLPVRQCGWFITPASDDPIDQEIATFVQHALFDWQTITWDDLLRHALLMLPFGVMPMEMVYEMRNYEGRDYITWRKFAARMPHTIAGWSMTNGENGIKQIKSDGKTVEIPIEKLVIFVNEKEGDNWYGTSILRAAYKHWKMKNGFYKIDAVAFERQGLGVPYAKTPAGITAEDENQVKARLKTMRAHENAYAVIPDGYEFGFLDMKAGTVRDPGVSIAHHNREITKAVLAQFLELGATEVGSRALSQDHSNLFLTSLEAVANAIADVFNNYAIKRLVDLNYSDVEAYPKLEHGSLVTPDPEKLANAYNTLKTAGALGDSANDRTFFRNLLGLPELTDDEKEQENETDPAEEAEAREQRVVEGLKLSSLKDRVKKKQEVDPQEIAIAVKEKIASMPTADALVLIDRCLADVKVITAYPQFYHEVRHALIARKRELQRKVFADKSDFSGWRKLTFAEKKVNWANIQEALDSMQAELTSEAQKILNKGRAEFVRKINSLADAGDVAGIKKLELKYYNEYLAAVTAAIKKSYEYGKLQASREMGVSAPANPNEVARQIGLMADTITDRTFKKIETDAKAALAEATLKQTPLPQAIGAVDALMAQRIVSEADAMAAITVGNALNVGRGVVFDEYTDMIYALQRSEILDWATCNFCLSVDGRVIDKDDKFARNTIFHSGCRGIWVEILVDEEEKPPVSVIPKTVLDRFGDTVNELIQPRTPITKKNSPASREAKKRKK